jgi:protein O-mannosyl-transferase
VVSATRPAFFSRPLVLAGILALVALAFYLPSLRYGFVWDDHRLVEHNPLLRTGHGLLQWMRSDFWVMSGANASGFWRPLVSLSYAVDGRLGQWQPGVYHLMNALAHAAVSALVMLLATAGGAPAWAALMGGLWFAAMPAHAESVGWIAGRTDVYCALFFLLALWLDRRARRRGRTWAGVLPLTALLLALLSKETAMPFVLVVAVAEWLDPTRSTRDRLRWLMPYAALTLATLALHLAFVHAPALSPAIDAVARARGRWASWTLFPGYVAFLSPGFVHSPGLTVRLPERLLSPEVIGGMLAVGVYAALLVWAFIRRLAMALPLALFGLTTLPPILAMVSQGSLLHAERFVYLPSAGVAWLLALVLGALPERYRLRNTGVVLAATLVLWSGVVLVRTLPAWASDAALFESMTRLRPRNAMAHLEWARVLLEADREPEAREELERAAGLDPNRPELFAAQARLHYRRGEWPQVLDAAGHALALDPGEREAAVLRATALVHLGRVREAEAAIARLRSMATEDAAVEALWGETLMMERRNAEALPVLERAARTATNDADLEFALGMVSASLGRPATAQESFARATAIDPTFYDAWLGLAQAAFIAGDRAACDVALVRASELPDARDGRAAAVRARVVATRPMP